MNKNLIHSNQSQGLIGSHSILKKFKNQIHSTKYKLIQAKGLGVMFESIIVHLRREND